MRTIIAPTDFSEVSYNACLYATKMAADIQAQLILLHVIELPITVTEFPVAESVYDEISMEEELEDLKIRLLKESQGKVNIRTVNIVGSIGYDLREMCHVEKPFAVVMATHRYNTLERFFMGSTTLYSAKHLDYPVLIVPAGATYKPIRKIAFAADLKNIYDIPLADVEKILTVFGASFEVFHVSTKQKNIDRGPVEWLLLEYHLRNFRPQFFTIENRDVTAGIATLAEEHGVDLLIILPRKHALFHKARSGDFIANSPVPVMALHDESLVQQADEAICSY